jgi:hypothetical protein
MVFDFFLNFAALSLEEWSHSMIVFAYTNEKAIE